MITAINAVIKYYESMEFDRCCNGNDCGCLGKPSDPEYYALQDLYLIRDTLTRQNLRRDVYSVAREVFGSQAQLIKAVEELSELTVEVAKAVNGKFKLDNLVDELADVKIMIEQIEYMTGTTDQVENRMATKIEKLREYIRNAK